MEQTDRQPASPEARHPVRVAVVVLVGVTAILGLKLGVFAITGSTAVLSDALESLVNITAAVLALFSVWYASRPADREHPYGHGKIEFVTAGVEGLLLLAAAAAIAVRAVGRLMHGGQIASIGTGMVALLGIAVLLGALAWYGLRQGRRLHSAALVADSRHLLVDVATTVGVAGALAVVKWTGWMWVDPAAAAALCVLVGWTAVGLLGRSLGGLLDRIDEADDAAIRSILDHEVAAGRIESYEKVRHRHQGAYHWVDMHLRFPPGMSVEQAHDRASRIEGKVERELGQANATAHIEPEKDA